MTDNYALKLKCRKSAKEHFNKNEMIKHIVFGQRKLGDKFVPYDNLKYFTVDSGLAEFEKEMANVGIKIYSIHRKVW